MNLFFFLGLRAPSKRATPNGAGRVVGEDGSLLWTGNFTNGSPEGEVGEELRGRVEHFHNFPLRMKRSLGDT